MSKRIGPKMAEAAAYVAEHPGCTKYAVGRAVGPHGSTIFGSRIIDRALRAGLIVDRRPADQWKSELYVTTEENQP